MWYTKLVAHIRTFEHCMIMVASYLSLVVLSGEGLVRIIRVSGGGIFHRLRDVQLLL